MQRNAGNRAGAQKVLLDWVLHACQREEGEGGLDREEEENRLTDIEQKGGREGLEGDGGSV